MQLAPTRHWQRPQRGGITILVALMLLVLLTIAAVAMARNSLREIASAGFGRQGAMARNVAESGLEWSIHWLDLQNAAVAPSGAAANLNLLKSSLLLDPSKAGKTWDLASTSAGVEYNPKTTTQAGLTLTATDSTTQASTLGLTYMGKLPVAGLSQGVGTGAYTPAAGGAAPQAPDLWALRADAQVVQGSATFVHAKELWVSTPVR